MAEAENNRLREQALFLAKKEWERTFDAVPDLIAILDNQHRITRVNRAMAQRLGLEPAACVGMRCYAAVHGLDAPPEFCPYSKTLADRGEHTVALCLDRLAGDFNVSTMPLAGPAGDVACVFHVAMHITESKKAEEALRESEARLRRAQEIAHLGSWELDVVADRLTWSEEVYRIFGLEPQASGTTYETFLAAVHPDDRDAVDAAYSGSLREGRDSYEIEHRVCRPSGEVRIVHEKCEHIRDSSGRVIRSIGMVHDVTSRKLAEDALRESETRYRLLFQNMLDGFAYCRMIYNEHGCPEDFVYLAVNDAFTRLTGLRDVTGKKVTEAIPGVREAHPELLETYGRVARTGRPERFEIDFRPLGMWLAVTVYCPQADHFVAVFDNITDRKRAEEALREADRRKDEFLSAASHELRTPLTTLSLHTQGLARMLTGGTIDEARVRRKLESMDGQLARLNRLIATLLDVSRIAGGRLHLEREPCDLAYLAADAVERFEDVAERSGTHVTLGASPVAGRWDRLRLEQVLTNLLDNAMKYAPGSSVEVTVEARGGEAVLTVRDSGPGISRESQTRIFQQYERAAEAHVFGGLGLGLWITRQIIEAHGGSITVESEPGAGSKFTVQLPTDAS